MQRQTSLEIPFGTCDFVSIQASRNADFDALATKAQSGIHRFTHGAAEANTFLELESARFGNQLCIEFRLVHFLNVDENIPVRALLQLDFQFVDLGALASDDDARTRSFDDDPQLVSGTLDFNCAHAGRLQFVLQLFLELHVFQKKLVVVPLHEPARLPWFGVAEPKSVGMYLLTHSYPFAVAFFEAVFFFAALPGVRFLVVALFSPTTVAAPALAARTRSARAISICAMRRW